MIQIIPQMKIFLAYESPDFRKGIDGLAALCRDKLEQDPFSGALFVFRNLKGTSIKILAYDGQGFWILQKRLSEGRFRWWPKKASDQTPAIYVLAAHELQVFIWNGDPKSTVMAPLWRPLGHPVGSIPLSIS